MSHQTHFAPTINMADERAKRRVRAGRVAPDFTFDPTVAKVSAPYRGETKDERHERLMNQLEPVGQPLSHQVLRGVLCWIAFPAVCFSAALWLFLR